jgi:hypothetical protein
MMATETFHLIVDAETSDFKNWVEEEFHLDRIPESMQVAEFVDCCIVSSGTIWNNRTWPLSLGAVLKENISTEGQILINQKTDFATGRTDRCVAEDADVGSDFSTIANQTGFKDFLTLIHTDGTVDSSNGEALSRKILAQDHQKNQRRKDSEKIDAQAVAFSNLAWINPAEHIAQ